MKIPRNYRWLLHFCCFYKGQENIDFDLLRKIWAIEGIADAESSEEPYYFKWLGEKILPSLFLFLSIEKQWVQNIVVHGENIKQTHDFIRLHRDELCNQRVLCGNMPLSLLAFVSEKLHQTRPELEADNLTHYLYCREKLFSCREGILKLDHLRLERLRWYSYHELVVNGNPEQIEWYDDIVPERFQTPSEEEHENFEIVDSVDGFPFTWTEYSGNRYRLKQMRSTAMVTMLLHASGRGLHVNWVADPDTIWGPIAEITLHPEYREVREELMNRTGHYNTDDYMMYYVGRYKPNSYCDLYVYRKELNQAGTPLMRPETLLFDYLTGEIQTPDRLGLSEDELLAKVKGKL